MELLLLIAKLLSVNYSGGSVIRVIQRFATLLKYLATMCALNICEFLQSLDTVMKRQHIHRKTSKNVPYPYHYIFQNLVKFLKCAGIFSRKIKKKKSAKNLTLSQKKSGVCTDLLYCNSQIFSIDCTVSVKQRVKVLILLLIIFSRYLELLIKFRSVLLDGILLLSVNKRGKSETGMDDVFEEHSPTETRYGGDHLVEALASQIDTENIMTIISLQKKS